MVRETGWSLQYVDGLSLADQHEYWQVTDGEGKARELQASRRKQAVQSMARGRRR